MTEAVANARAQIAVIGAGAKAAALVARASVLEALGITNVPNVVVFEAAHIGAAWSGRGGFSSGYLTLCTPGEKDVGFPYDETVRWGELDQPVSPQLFGRFSFAAFLVSQGLMSEWVDKGRPYPTHGRWAEYLCWVFQQAGANPTIAKVTDIEASSGRWKVAYEDAEGARSSEFDGVVLTGSGRSRTVKVSKDMPAGRVFDAETFWETRKTIADVTEGRIVVAGRGGATGAVLAWLCERFAEQPKVSIINVNRMGTLFTRGDGYAERRWFSDPSEWAELDIGQRREFFSRTEAGVISIRNKEAIDSASNIRYHRGRVESVDWSGEDITIGLKSGPSLSADYFVMAGGFEAWSLLDKVRAPGLEPDKLNKERREHLELTLAEDLAFAPDSGVPKGLHVPALAGLARGPGMANLGCLGLMAKSILTPYQSG